ncbi:MAG: 50S ribosomal protein L19 [Bacteroidia bacterium]|nr:50S ribosomal protein L19 [Bacteroidia bacterium]
MDAIKYVEDQFTREMNYPDFRVGDSVEVSLRIIEGEKQRIQKFKGDVIQMNGVGAVKTFTVRKMSNGVGVERIIPFASPNIDEIKVLKKGKVRRSKLYYVRDLVGKKARIKEKTFIKN